MEINSLLQNENVKNILGKAGIPQNKMQDVASQAIAAVQSHITQHPSQMNSLLSAQPNTAQDSSMKAEVEHDFVQNLIQKVGLPENVAKQAKEIIPTVLNQFTGKLSTEGLNSIPGISNAMNAVKNVMGSEKKNL